jgi:hypothetical protein
MNVPADACMHADSTKIFKKILKMFSNRWRSESDSRRAPGFNECFPKNVMIGYVKNKCDNSYAKYGMLGKYSLSLLKML